MENQKIKLQFTLSKFSYNFWRRKWLIVYKITLQAIWKIFDKVKQDKITTREVTHYLSNRNLH